MMMPMSVTCGVCGEYIYRGTKFNSRKETVQGEDYLGIKIFRFYMRCPNCNAEFTIKTDPKHADYVVEHNCSRQVEPWKEEEDARQTLVEKRMADEQGDAMKQLEGRVMDSKQEMEQLEALDTIKAWNARAAHMGAEGVLKAVEEKRKKELEEQDQDVEQQVEQVFGGGLKRIVDDDGGAGGDDDDPEKLLTRRKRKVEPPVKKEDEKVEDAKKPLPSSLLRLVHY